MPMRTFVFLCFLAVSAALQAQVAVVNGASFRAGQPVTAGSWVSAFGGFMGVATMQAASLPLPTDLGGVTVTVDGVAAPLNYVSDTQINFLIPLEVTPGLRGVAVTTAQGTLNGEVRVINAAPGLFQQDTAEPPRGAIQNQDFSENHSTRPAIRGQAIILYATGPGAFNQQIAIGSAAPAEEPLVRTQSTPQVFIGGVEAEVQFSGLAPNFAGLWQINAIVPDLPFLFGRLPVVVFMNGVDSNEVTVHVAQ